MKNIHLLPFQKTRLLACLFAIFFIACKQENKAPNYKSTQKEITKKIQFFYTTQLYETIQQLDSLNLVKDFKNQLKYYKNARTAFKKIEPILAFVDKNNYNSLNSPNIVQIDEEDVTDVKKRFPFGFQVIEELLHEDKADEQKINEIVEITRNRLNLLAHNNKLYLKEHHILWLIRNQIARTALTGIAGFDSPVLEQSISEAKTVYGTILYILKQHQSKFKNKELYYDWLSEIQKTQNSLSGSFNEFDRYHFIKNHAHKQLELLVKTAEDWKVTYPFTMAFNNDITSFFSKKTFHKNFFSDYKMKNEYFDEKSSIGKKLFNDSRLSKNNDMSCATCHHEEKAFTDGLVHFPNQKRNTPTLTYASLQKAFFYDGRSGSLEGQIVSVVHHKNEFNTDLNQLEEVVKNDSVYAMQFKKIYKNTNHLSIRNAIATYIRSLEKFESKFDKNINNQENTLTLREINGFNLFMGKAKCATCHFPPVFNGTVPPNFMNTEFELIGTPSRKNKKQVSEDLGRYDLFKTPDRKHFFKTPTIRNIEKTAPYMHNGVYTSLNEVMDFYNKGGGVGEGFVLENQTLPPNELHLTEQEIDDIIKFMHTLTD